MKITFKRFGKSFKGKIVKVLENSVIVEIAEKDMDALQVSNNLTVIAKKRIVSGVDVSKLAPGALD